MKDISQILKSDINIKDVKQENGIFCCMNDHFVSGDNQKYMKMYDWMSFFYDFGEKRIFALVKLKLCIMFRSFIFLLVSLLLVSCETSSHREMDWKDQNLHGKVKKLIVTLYNLSDPIERKEGTPSMSQERLTVSIFNNKGFLMEETDSISNKPKSKTIYNYLKDNVVEIDMYGEGRKVKKITLKYNNKGEIIDEEMLEYILVNEQDSTYIKEETSIFVNKYDKKGNKISQERLSNFKSEYFGEFKYDEKGNIIEVIENFHDALKLNKKFEIDDKGNILSIKMYDLDEGLIREYSVTDYVYDEKHNWISRKIEVRNKNNEYIETGIEKRIISYYE